MSGSPSRSIAASKSSALGEHHKIGGRDADRDARRLVASLSMPIAEPMTPLPV